MKKQKKDWMQDAVGKPGSLRSTLNIKKNKTIPLATLKAAANKPGKEGQRARLALVFRKSK